MSAKKKVLIGWLVAAVSAALVVAAYAAGNLPQFRAPVQRTEHAREGQGIPPDMTVVGGGDGKLFHLASCAYIHDKAHLRTMTASEAIKEGYSPCTRCLKEYLGEN